MPVIVIEIKLRRGPALRENYGLLGSCVVKFFHLGEGALKAGVVNQKLKIRYYLPIFHGGPAGSRAIKSSRMSVTPPCRIHGRRARYHRRRTGAPELPARHISLADTASLAVLIGS